MSGWGDFVRRARSLPPPLSVQRRVPYLGGRFDFRYILRRYCGAYVTSRYTGNPGYSLSQHNIAASTYWTRG